MLKMDYRKIHDAIISKALSEERYKDDDVYYEAHHIIPDFMFIHRKRKGPKGHLPGNPDAPSNIVLLTPREHFIVHLLLVKIYEGTRYHFSCASALIFFAKVDSSHPRQQAYKMTSWEYAKARQEGIEAISKARRGKMPCVDSETGEAVGSWPVDHPNVLSGKWQHHSKGFVVVRRSDGSTHKIRKDEFQQNKDKYELASNKPQDGENNGNYKLLTQEVRDFLIKDIVNIAIKVDDVYWFRPCDIVDYFKTVIAERLGYKKLSSMFIKNKFGSIQELINEVAIENKINVSLSTVKDKWLSRLRKQLNAQNKSYKEDYTCVRPDSGELSQFFS